MRDSFLANLHRAPLVLALAIGAAAFAAPTPAAAQVPGKVTGVGFHETGIPMWTSVSAAATYRFRMRSTSPLEEWRPNTMGWDVDARATAGAVLAWSPPEEITENNFFIGSSVEMQVAGVNTAGVGAWSDGALFTSTASSGPFTSATPTAPGLPTNVSTAGVSGGITLTWTAGTGTTTRYRVRWRLTDADGAGSGTDPGAWQGWAAATGYTIVDSDDGIDTASTATSYTIRNLTAGVSYDVAVAGVNEVSASAFLGGGTGTPLSRTTVSTLSGLTIAGGRLSPEFAANTLSYTASVAHGATSITVTPTTTTADATITIKTGAAAAVATTSGQASVPQTLATTGSTTITLVVTAGVGGGTNTYTITVNRLSEAVSADARLASLVSSGGWTLYPPFDPDETEYQMRIANCSSTTSFMLDVARGATATIAGTAATGDPLEVSASIASPEGNNIIMIEVMAADGSMKVYRIVASCPPSGANANANLTALTISAGTLTLTPTPAFAAATTDYTIEGASGDITFTILEAAIQTGAFVVVNDVPCSITDNADGNAGWGCEVEGIAAGSVIEILVIPSNNVLGDAETYTFTIPIPSANAEPVVRAAASAHLSAVLDVISANALDAPSDNFSPFFKLEPRRGGARQAFAAIAPRAAAPLLLSEQPINRDADWRDLLGASSFRLNLTPAERWSNATKFLSGGTWSVWGAGDVRGFSGSDDVEGLTYAGYVGADYKADNWLAGIAASYSATDAKVDDEESQLWFAGAYPYARYTWAERVDVWLLAGAGYGALTLGEETPLVQHLYAAGAKADIFRAGNLTLAAKTDGAAIFSLSIGEGEEIDVMQQRFRLAADVAYDYTVQDHTIRPHLEIGARIDFAEEIIPGAEVAGGVRYEFQPLRLSVDVRGRALVYDTTGLLREWGAGATIRLAPNGGGTGLSASLTPGWGAPQSRTDNMWQDNTPALTQTTNPAQALTLRGELAYTFKHKQARITPLTQYALTTQSQTVAIGTRLNLAPLALEVLGEHITTQDDYRLRLNTSLRF